MSRWEVDALWLCCGLEQAVILLPNACVLGWAILWQFGSKQSYNSVYVVGRRLHSEALPQYKHLSLQAIFISVCGCCCIMMNGMLFLWAFLSLIPAIEKIFKIFFSLLISSLAVGISTVLINLLQRFCFEIMSHTLWIYEKELSNFVLAKSIWNNKISTITLHRRRYKHCGI